MFGAVGVAAGLLAGGIDNPAVLDIPPAVRARTTALVAQLGDRVFAERDAASKELETLGRLALPAVRAGRRSPDPEVRRRSDQLARPMEDADLAARLRVFVADAAGRFDHRVPGWELVRAFAGDDAAARTLFADAVRDRGNWPMLAALRGPGVEVRPGVLATAGGLGAWADRPGVAAAAKGAAERRWEFFARNEAPPTDDDDQPRKRQEPTVPEMALVVLAECLCPDRPGGRRGSYERDVNSFLGTAAGDAAFRGQGRYGPAFARLMRVWLDTRDGPTAAVALFRAKRAGLPPDVLGRYAARVLARTDLPPELRAMAALDLPVGAAQHLGAVLGGFADQTPVPTGLEVRDVMLWTAVRLTNQPTADYGFRDGPAGPT